MKIEGEISGIRDDVSTLNEIKHEKHVKEKRQKTLFSKHNIQQENKYQQSLKNWNNNYKLKPDESRDWKEKEVFLPEKYLPRKRKEILSRTREKSIEIKET